ncbi:MAG: hypothetical protein OEZ54_03935 [Gemmatimonadota bacterium]|nr:hypothetical protein [Gemmatimonadota bacterium]
MRELTAQEMSMVDGEGFWSGFSCGVAFVATAAAFLAPEPSSKIVGLSLLATVGTCGKAIFG